MIRSERAHLHVAALTHPGLSGKNNEDRFAVSAYRLGSNNPTPSLFAIVSDGIGGHRAGEIAAEMAVNTISHTIAQSDGSQPLATLEQAIHAASQAVAAQAQADAGRQGMGATCACTWVIGNRLYTASVGDSRIYLLRDRKFRQITTDHTWIQEAMDKGILDVEQARNHPNIHVIRRYLGSAKSPQVDLRLHLRPGESDAQAEANQGLALHPGDMLLLCTDGLTDLVHNEEISRVMCQRGDLQTVAQSLIDLACVRGGHDNITVILLSVPK